MLFIIGDFLYGKGEEKASRKLWLLALTVAAHDKCPYMAL
jgi:hypothetical protein